MRRIRTPEDGFAASQLFVRRRRVQTAPTLRVAFEVPHAGATDADLDALPPLPVPTEATAGDEPYSPTQATLPAPSAAPAAPATALMRTVQAPAPAVARVFVCEVEVRRRATGRMAQLYLQVLASSAEDARTRLRAELRDALVEADALDASMLECVQHPERFRFTFEADSATARAHPGAEYATLFAALAACELHAPALGEFSLHFMGDPP